MLYTEFTVWKMYQASQNQVLEKAHMMLNAGPIMWGVKHISLAQT